MNECPYHSGPEYRECHHIGDRFVAVYLNPEMGRYAWIATLGRINHRGSVSGWALYHFEDFMRELREETKV